MNLIPVCKYRSSLSAGSPVVLLHEWDTGSGVSVAVYKQLYLHPPVVPRDSSFTYRHLHISHCIELQWLVSIALLVLFLKFSVALIIMGVDFA